MNITLRCRGSKQEQARPPICAARRRCAGYRGDQTNTALNARVRPSRPHGYGCRDLVLVALAKLAPHHLVAPRRFFLRFVGELGFHYIVVERAYSLSKVDAVERKPCAQSSPPGAVSQPMSRSALFSVLSDIGTPFSLDVQHIADQRRAIGAFGVGFACA